jgi:hypothetical protein
MASEFDEYRQRRLEPTQLAHYYDSLHELKEQEQTALAELHAEDPKIRSD